MVIYTGMRWGLGRGGEKMRLRLEDLGGLIDGGEDRTKR